MVTISVQDILSSGGKDCREPKGEYRRMETRLRELREKARPGWSDGYTLGFVAERIAEWFAANKINKGATMSQISKLERGETPLSDDWLNAFSVFYDVPVRELFPDKPGSAARAPLVGFVGAGEMYYPDPLSGPWVGFDEVDAPPGVVGVRAVRVRGDSMAPAFRDGDHLFFKPVDQFNIEECLDRDCLVQLKGGSAYIKRVEKGPRGKVRLVSYGELDPIDNPDIAWAAPVEWVKKR
jgi:hypothetical protein